MPKIRINERVFKSAEDWENKTGGQPETAVDIDKEAGLDDPAVPEEEEEAVDAAEPEGGEEDDLAAELSAELGDLEESSVQEACGKCGHVHGGNCATIKVRLQDPFQEDMLEEGKIPNDAWSKFKPWMKQSQDLVYYAPRDRTPPLEGGMVRLAASISQQGIGKMHKGQMKYKHYERNMVVIHVWQPGFKVVSGDSRDPSSEKMPYGEGELTFIEHAIRVDAKFIEPADDGRFVDVANWVLKKRGITDRYASILDFNGKIIATKGMQKKYSNAGAISWDED